MTLTPGARLGVYVVAAQIGEGGMGQVFRATDTKLKRQVALKILPPSLAADHDRLARFQREAEVLASLNHPHIAGIYGFEERDGVSALVMELIDGEDLSQRIARGAVPIEEALPIARQIADALEAAHEQGIIHRDLKPANIKVRADGTVKVLDFGLAKALDRRSGIGEERSSLANSLTITSPAMTMNGVILGTAAYMAPEQAKGRSVDKRADIWAFGVVLYEMLTGKRLFDADGVSETLAAVLTREISLTALPAAIPTRLRALLRDCLIRDPRQRLRDIGGARIVLDKIIAGTPDDAVAALPVTATQPRSIAARALPWAVAAVLFAALNVALWVLWPVEKLVERTLVQFDVDLGAGAALPAANRLGGSNIAISPDGMRLVYTSGTPQRLFTRRLDQANATELPGTQGATFPFFSPDGQWVGFGANGQINKISVGGGAVIPLGETIVTGATWAEDGSILVSDAFRKGLQRFPDGGGAPTILVPRVDGELGLVVPWVLPGGHAILCAACIPGGGADTCNIEVLTLANGRRKVLARGGQSPRYLPSSNGIGHLLYVNKATLFAIPFDPATLETRGTPVAVLDDVGYASATGAGLYDVSHTGTLIYRRSRDTDLTMVRWISSSDGATSKTEALRATPGAYQDVSVSPDGKRVALVIADGSNRDIWVHDPQRDALMRLTFGGINRAPTWSPDGQYIVSGTLGLGILQTRADGASRPQPLTGSKTSQTPSSFTPDGKRLAYMESAGGRSQIATVPLDDQGGQLRAGTPEPLKSSFSDQAPSFSPDGRWLAYQSNESGRIEVYVRAFPPPSSGPGRKWQISNNGGSGPRWSRTAHELVYRSADQLMTVSYSVKDDTFVAEKPRVWIARLGGNEWDLAPAGRRVAVVIPEASAQARQERVIVMLQNFADELRRRVPSGK